MPQANENQLKDHSPNLSPAPSNGDTQKKRDRFYDIDGLRFFAALVVVLYHYTYRGHAADGLNPTSFEWLGTLTRYGYLGVDLFFIISGFVILMSAGHGDWIKFAISRFVRIYPTLWVAIVLTGATMFFYDVAPLIFEIKTWILNFVLVGSYVGVPYLDSVYWSLLVEIKFYFLIFVSLIVGWINHTARLLMGWLIISAVLTLSPIHIPYLGFFFFPEWSHYFIAGSAFFLMRRDGIDLTNILLVAGSFLLSLHYGYQYLLTLEAKFETEFSFLVAASFIASFYALFTLVALNKTRAINLPWMLKFGALTYPLYLIHQNIGYIGFNLLEDYLPGYVTLTILLGLMILISYVITEFAEQTLNPFFKRNIELFVRWVKEFR